jgi:hypothetical protein
MNGMSILSCAKYQLAPAVTKNAPDKNLNTSFHLILFIPCCLIYACVFLFWDRGCPAMTAKRLACCRTAVRWLLRRVGGSAMFDGVFFSLQHVIVHFFCQITVHSQIIRCTKGILRISPTSK